MVAKVSSCCGDSSCNKAYSDHFSFFLSFFCFWSVLVRFCQFYSSFQRTGFLSHWFALLFSISLTCGLTFGISFLLLAWINFVFLKFFLLSRGGSLFYWFDSYVTFSVTNFSILYQHFISVNEMYQTFFLSSPFILSCLWFLSISSTDTVTMADHNVSLALAIKVTMKLNRREVYYTYLYFYFFLLLFLLF